MKQSKLQIVRVNTTAYEEEDFYILTSLTHKQILKAIKPIIINERKGKAGYDNDILAEAIKKAYPKETVIYYPEYKFMTI